MTGGLLVAGHDSVCFSVLRVRKKHFRRINDELLQLCKRLNEKRDMGTSSRLIPWVDDLTHIFDRNGQEQIALMQPHKGYFIEGSALLVHTFNPRLVR
jgi:hypothetical protein